MKIPTTVKTICCALTLAAVARGQQMPRLHPPRSGFLFPERQTLTYAVDWRVFPAGTAVIRVEADGPRERISATAESAGAINLLLHVNDRFQSAFDRSTGCTLEFDKQTVEGRRQVNATLHMDERQRRSILDERNLVSGQGKHVESPVPDCTTDLLTGMFYIASQDLVVGQDLAVPLVDAMHSVPVTVKVEGREVVKTPLGAFKTIRVQPTAPAGVVRNRGDIRIWYTDDDRHLPVQMRARLFWGTVTFRLTGVDGR